MARGGRPTKLTPETQRAIIADLAAGLPRTTAAARAGIAFETFSQWMKKGRAGKAGFVGFSDAVKKAEQDAVAKNVATIQKAAAERDEVTTKTTVKADGSTETVTTTRRVFEWTAAAWYLERKYPEDWSSGRGEIAELRRQLKELYRLVGAGIQRGTTGNAATPAGEAGSGPGDAPPPVE